MKDSEQIMAKKIAEAVSKAGGKTYYVGGYVRDRLLGKVNKDIDLEVHGITAGQLEEILTQLGEPMKKGVSFGVFGMRHYDIDIALPRSEKNTGRGHRDFEIFTDPFIGEKKAASRRDFSMNALMQNVLTGEILDFFGGQQDLKNQVLRHVDDAGFIEDPLRVFRGAQFAARFEFEPAKGTLELMRMMDVTTLSKERVFDELAKVLIKAERPSTFFEVLRQIDQLSFWFPECEALIDCPQDPVHHPEGDVWTHTMQVLDMAADLRREARHPLWLMISAFLHDFGKPLVTTEKNGRIHAYNHEKVGMEAVESWLSRLTNEHALKKYVRNMTLLHMQPNLKASAHASKKSFMKMFDQSVCPEDLLLLAKADHCGRVKISKTSATAAGSRCIRLSSNHTHLSACVLGTALHPSPSLTLQCHFFQGRQDSNHRPVSQDFLNQALPHSDYTEIEKILQERLQDYRQLMAKPYLSGEDLINAGIQPGPVFKTALDYAHKLRLAGLSKDDQLRQTLGFIRSHKR